MSKTEVLLKDFRCIGVNHWSAPVEIRERFSLSESKKIALYSKAKEMGLSGIIIVSTCNRTELFSDCADSSVLIDFLTEFSEGERAEFEEYGFETYGEDAVRHIFEVAAGLDAQILGDLQIIKQVKESYDLAAEMGTVNSGMHRLMQSVFKAHKRIRKETDLGVGTASVASAAVQFAQHHFKNFTEKKVVLVGTGKMGKITCKNLINMGVKQITLVNRSEDKAEFLAGKYQIKAATMNQLPEVLEQADLVIAATGAQEPVIKYEQVKLIDEKGPKRFFVDLSVPRNIDDSVKENPAVVLINMDDLQGSMDKAFSKRKSSIPLANQFIRHELHEYRNWLAQQQLAPQITAMNERLESIKKAELERFKHQFSQEDWEKVELLAHRIVRKIANDQLESLKEEIVFS